MSGREKTPYWLTALLPVAACTAILAHRHARTPPKWNGIPIMVHQAGHPPQQHTTPHAAGILGLVGWQLFQQGGGMQAGQSEGAAAATTLPPPPPPPREQAVLVLGATGRVGRRVVQKVGRRSWRGEGDAEVKWRHGGSSYVWSEQHVVDAAPMGPGPPHAKPAGQWLVYLALGFPCAPASLHQLNPPR